MKIVAFEGIDASGKQTQVKLLYERLLSQGFKVAVESFPRYQNPIGELLQKWFCKEIDLTTEAVHMLLEADRQDFMGELKFLDNEYDFLLLDRFTLSNLAFGVAKGLSLEWLRSLQSNIRRPDVTFILDIDVETSLRRKPRGRDRHEEDKKLLQKARNAYLEIAEKLSKEEDNLIFVIPADEAPPEVIHESIFSHLQMIM